MFSFEGTFRRTPTVSLGGRSKKVFYDITLSAKFFVAVSLMN